MAPWRPGMAWPSGTPGGAAAPSWGGYVRLWLQAAIAPGRAFHMGTHAQDRLDAGNVVSGGGVPSVIQQAGSPNTLWVDLTCDTITAEIQGGASGGQGIFSKADANTITITLADPTGKYDPLNPHSPYAYGGRSRLVPGVPVQAFAEVVNGDTGTWQRYWLFVGTADSWAEDWTPHPSSRQCTLLATDITKQFVRMDRPEQASQGGGETVRQRIQRIVTFFGWGGTVVDPPGGSAIAEQATTLAQPAWELLNRTTDDEIGYLYFDTQGRLRWLNRQTWGTINTPVLTFSCDYLTGVAGFDVLTDATPSTVELQMRNTVYASRAGGTMQTAVSQASVDRYGIYEYKRTDLGLNTDTLVAQWAEYVLTLYAFPQVTLQDVTMLPALWDKSWEVWQPVLNLTMVTDIVHVRWAPPDRPADAIDAWSRVVGVAHRISRRAWETQWQLVAASNLGQSGTIFTMGPDPQDRLDTNYVLGFVKTPGRVGAD